MTAAFAFTNPVPRPAPRLVWDLECVSDWPNLAATTQAKLRARHERLERKLPAECRALPEHDPERAAALNPWTAQIVCVALYEPDRQCGRVLYRTPGNQNLALLAPPHWAYEHFASERLLLERFWTILARNAGATLVGFNSRGYDGLLVFIRSFIHDVEATVNVLPYRYSTREVLDLQDVLGGWNGGGKTPGLDLVCELSGIRSSKGEGLDGAGVQRAWDAGRIAEIVRYCAEDTRATAELADRWRRTVGPVFGNGERRKFG
jgi:hypothetical protein